MKDVEAHEVERRSVELPHKPVQILNRNKNISEKYPPENFQRGARCGVGVDFLDPLPIFIFDEAPLFLL